MRYSIPFIFFATASEKTVCKDGTPHFWEALDRFQEMNLTATMGISTPWKGLQKKVHRNNLFFYHYCTVKSNHVHHPNETKCHHFCADRWDEDWLCSYHDYTTNEAFNDTKKHHAVTVKDIRKTLQLTQESPKVISYSDTYHGHFCVKHSVDYSPSGMDDIDNFTDFLCDQHEL